MQVRQLFNLLTQQHGETMVFNFEPIIGEVYHLYNNAQQTPFLSIISPNQCNFEHLGSFRLNSQKMWEKQ